MKVGIIGESKNLREIFGIPSNGQGKFTISGYYAKTQGEAQITTPNYITQYENAEELINDSDILYINDHPEALEIARKAVKVSTHLFVESPFLFKEKEFDQLFELADETNVLIKFNQNILQNQTFKKHHTKAFPEMLKVRIDRFDQEPDEGPLKEHLFQFATILRNHTRSGIRKINLYKGKHTDNFFSLNVHLDNDTNCEFMYNSITEKDRFFVELFYPEKLTQINLTENRVTIIDKQSAKNKDISPQQGKTDLTQLEINHFVADLPKLQSMPVTIREENQYLLYLTHRLSEKLLQS